MYNENKKQKMFQFIINNAVYHVHWACRLSFIFQRTYIWRTLNERSDRKLDVYKITNQIYTDNTMIKKKKEGQTKKIQNIDSFTDDVTTDMFQSLYNHPALIFSECDLLH